jgi:excisionase family DNA binding protein
VKRSRARAIDPTADSRIAGIVPLWTVTDVCRFLNVSKRWVHERTRRHDIPCYRFGPLLRFDPEEIANWVAKNHHLPEEGVDSGDRSADQ